MVQHTEDRVTVEDASALTSTAAASDDGNSDDGGREMDIQGKLYR